MRTGGMIFGCLFVVVGCSGGGGTSSPSASTAPFPKAPGTTVTGSVTSDTNASGTDATEATGSTGSSSTTVPGLSASSAASLLATFDPGSARADDLVIDRADPAVIAAAGEVLAAGGTPWQEWAAVYVWANEGEGAAPLMAYLDNDDVAVRAMAAAGVLGRGEVAGFGPLIALLEDTDMLAGSEPPTSAWTFATTILVSLTGEAGNGPPFDADASQRHTAELRWSAWLDEHRATLHFDDNEGRWLV